MGRTRVSLAIVYLSSLVCSLRALYVYLSLSLSSRDALVSNEFRDRCVRYTRKDIVDTELPVPYLDIKLDLPARVVRFNEIYCP